MIRVAWYTALVLATLTVLIILWQFSSAVILFLLSLALAAAFRPIIENLIERGFPKSLSLIIAFGLTFLVLGVLIFAAGGQVIRDLQKLTDHLFVGYEALKINWLAQDNSMLKGFAEQMPTPKALYSALTGEQAARMLRTVFGTAQGVFDFFARMVIVVVLSLYWSIDHVRFERLWLSLLPVESRARARDIWFAVEAGVGAYIRREGSLSVIGGVIIWLVYISLGIEYATLLALVGSVVRLIPWLGLVLVVVLPLLAGSIYGIWAALTASGLTLSILILLEVLVGNKLLPSSRYSSLLLMIIVIVLAESYGLVGAVFAPILAVALQIFVKKLAPVHAGTENKETQARFAGLQPKMEKIKQMAAELDREDSTHSINLVSRLETLIQKANGVNSGERAG